MSQAPSSNPLISNISLEIFHYQPLTPTMDLSSISKVTVPIAYYTLANVAFSYTLHGSFHTKLISFPIMLWLAVSAFRCAAYWPGEIPTLWGLLMTTWLAHTNSVLWLEDHSQLSHAKRLQPSLSSNGGIHASWLWDNPRLIGTKRSVLAARNISKHNHKQQQQHHSEVHLPTWTLRQLLRLLVLVCIFTYQHQIFPGLAMPLTKADFHPDRESLFRRFFFHSKNGSHSTSAIPFIDAHELKLRSILAIWWAAGTYLGLTICHLALSLLFVVVIRTDKPEDWPALFGSMTQITSLRAFWSKFWHKIVVRSYTNYGLFFSRRILRLRRGSKGEELVVIAAVFFLSGCAHSVVAWQLGDRCGWGRDVMWFLGNFVGGLVEVVVRKGIERIARVCGQEDVFLRLRNGSVGRVVGFLWVFLFFFWSVPKWLYPKIDCAIEDALMAQAAR